MVIRFEIGEERDPTVAKTTKLDQTNVHITVKQGPQVLSCGSFSSNTIIKNIPDCY